jgi:hypothetical protein
MKTFLLILIGLGSCLSATSQNCSSLYVFDPQDKNSHYVVSRESSETKITANGKAAAVQTNALPIRWNEKGRSALLHVDAKFDCSANLETRDFVWIYFRINGVITKTITVKATPNTNSIRISDSISVPFGSKVTMRAAMVCDSPDEYISLEKGYLELCQVVSKIDDKEQALEEVPINFEPFMQVMNVGDKVKVIWKSGRNENCNLFRLERTNGGDIWATAGYAKDDCSGKSICDYVFFDSHPQTTTIGYRIMQVDRFGKEKVLGEESRPLN